MGYGKRQEAKWGAGILAPIEGSGFLQTASAFSGEKPMEYHEAEKKHSKKNKRRLSSEDVSMDEEVLDVGNRKENHEYQAVDTRSIRKRHKGVIINVERNEKEEEDYILKRSIESLDKGELVQMIIKMVEKNEGLKSTVRELLPAPSVERAIEQLEKLENKVQNLLPYNKNGPVFDEYTFNRVRPALMELHNTIVRYMDYYSQTGLTSRETRREEEREGTRGVGSVTARPYQPLPTLSHPSEWFMLLIQATTIVCRMPRWEQKEGHQGSGEEGMNWIRTDSIRHMADGWLKAIVASAAWIESGHFLGQSVVAEWEKSMLSLASDSGCYHAFVPAISAFKEKFGWVTCTGEFGTSSFPVSSFSAFGNNVAHHQHMYKNGLFLTNSSHQ